MVSNATNPSSEGEHAPIQTRMLNEVRELEKQKQLNPPEDKESRNQFLCNFDWTDSTLEFEAKQTVEDLFVEFHDIFERHRFDIGIKTEFTAQLTSFDNRPAYSQGLPAPINFNVNILVEISILHKYGIVATFL